jgi:hypothetical protein
VEGWSYKVSLGDFADSESRRRRRTNENDCVY